MFDFGFIGFPYAKVPTQYGGQAGIRGSSNPDGLRMIPQGEAWYVDGSHPLARDGNDGVDPRAPLLTIQEAIDRVNATIDWATTPPYKGVPWIIIAPGQYAENLTPPFYCKMLGLGLATGNTNDWCVNIEPLTGSPLAGTGLALHMMNIRLTCNDANPVMDFGVMNSCVFEGLAIVDGNPGLATVGIDTTGANSSQILRCRFVGNSNPLTRGIRSTGDFFGCVVEDCHIEAVTCGIDLSGAALVGNALIKHNVVMATTVGIDDSVVGGSAVIDNWVSAADAISHANMNRVIANHVMNGAVGAVESALTD